VTWSRLFEGEPISAKFTNVVFRFASTKAPLLALQATRQGLCGRNNCPDPSEIDFFLVAMPFSGGKVEFVHCIF
jgi:hypothetical protein